MWRRRRSAFGYSASRFLLPAGLSLSTEGPHLYAAFDLHGRGPADSLWAELYFGAPFDSSGEIRVLAHAAEEPQSFLRDRVTWMRAPCQTETDRLVSRDWCPQHANRHRLLAIETPTEEREMATSGMDTPCQEPRIEDAVGSHE